MILYLVRHGQTEWNQEGRMQGRLDSPLTPLGREQAILLGERLKNEPLDAVYSSPTGRAYTTARLILPGRESMIQQDDRLKEIDMGDWEGMSFAQVEKKYPQEFKDFCDNPHRFHFDSAEDYQDLVKRAGSILREIRQKYPEQNVLVVTHGATLLALLHILENTELSTLWDRGLVPPASISRIEIHGQAIRIDYVGNISHYEEVLSDDENE